MRWSLNLVLILSYLNLGFSEKVSNNELISNIHRSSNIHKQLEDRLSKIEEQIKDDDDSKTLNKVEAKLEQTDRQLQTLNQHLLGIQKTINNLANARSRVNFPKNCNDVRKKGANVTGTYSIFPEFAPEPFLVLCDLDRNDGGWTYVLNRFNGNQDFFLDWDDYKNGFGNLADEFWLGLERLYYLTGHEVNELLVELEDWDSKTVKAHYSLFSIGDENEGFSLKLLGGYSGDAGDSLSYHAGMKFSTKDKDQDRYNGANCATYRSGAWWYKNCVNSHLTGKYMRGAVSDNNEYNGMYWEKFHGAKYSLKEARMLVKPRSRIEADSSESSEENNN